MNARTLSPHTRETIREAVRAEVRKIVAEELETALAELRKPADEPATTNRDHFLKLWNAENPTPSLNDDPAGYVEWARKRAAIFGMDVGPNAYTLTTSPVTLEQFGKERRHQLEAINRIRGSGR